MTLDLLQARRTVRTVQFTPGNGTFSFSQNQEYRIEVTASDTCRVGELAEAIVANDRDLSAYAHYLAALVLDQKADVPVPAQEGYTFGAFSVLESMPENDLKRKTGEFLAFRNALRVLYGRIGLNEIFQSHGRVVAAYGRVLEELSGGNDAVRVRLAEHERDAQMLAQTEQPATSSYSAELLSELAAAEEWGLLAEHAERHLDSPVESVVILAKRMQALALAHSDDGAEKQAALEIYRSLRENGHAAARDIGNLVTLLLEMHETQEAKALVLEGIRTFPANARYFSEIGHRIVEATGDRGFRSDMETAINEKRPA